MISSSLLSAPSFWRSYVLPDMRLAALLPFPARPPPERDWTCSALLCCTSAGPSSLTKARCSLVLLTSVHPATYLLHNHRQLMYKYFRHYPTRVLPAPRRQSTSAPVLLDLLLSLLLQDGFTLLSFFTFRSSTPNLKPLPIHILHHFHRLALA